MKEKLIQAIDRIEKSRLRLFKLAGRKGNIPGRDAEINQAFSNYQLQVRDLIKDLGLAGSAQTDCGPNLPKTFSRLAQELEESLLVLESTRESGPENFRIHLSESKKLMASLKDEILHRWSGPLKVKILGIGEITTTIELVGEGAPRRRKPGTGTWVSLAVKKAPSFLQKADAEKYREICFEYEKFLSERLGILTPYADHALMPGKEGRWLVYNLQERLPKESIACLVIQVASPEVIDRMFLRLLNEMKKIFKWNQAHPEYSIGFDGQIPNWAFIRFSPQHPMIEEDEPLLYIDTTTPLIRRQGKEQLDTELFIKSIPVFLRPIVRRTLLKQVLDRYYSPRDVTLDLIASLVTHKRKDLVPRAIDLTNSWLQTMVPEMSLAPFTEKEIAGYNREDVMIWKFFRQMKRMDRFVTEKILGRSYEQRLPKGSPLEWENLVGAGGKGLTMPESLKAMLKPGSSP